MANPLDTDAGTELFSSYEAEFGVVKADLTQKLDQIPDLSGEPRKAALAQAERALDEADELVRFLVITRGVLLFTMQSCSDMLARAIRLTTAHSSAR